MPSRERETEPLLTVPSLERQYERAEYSHFSWLSHDEQSTKRHSPRLRLQRLLSSKPGHYSIICLIVLDVLCINFDSMVTVLLCKTECNEERRHLQDLLKAAQALGIISLVVSSLFLVELIANLVAVGTSYFHYWFNWLDATVIVSSFATDVWKQGSSSEIGLPVVVLRLWRVFKIMEELSDGAQEEFETFNRRLQTLEHENMELRSRLDAHQGTS